MYHHTLFTGFLFSVSSICTLKSNICFIHQLLKIEWLYVRYERNKNSKVFFKGYSSIYLRIGACYSKDIVHPSISWTNTPIKNILFCCYFDFNLVKYTRSWTNCVIYCSFVYVFVNPWKIWLKEVILNKSSWNKVDWLYLLEIFMFSSFAFQFIISMLGSVLCMG